MDTTDKISYLIEGNESHNSSNLVRNGGGVVVHDLNFWNSHNETEKGCNDSGYYDESDIQGE